MDPYIETNLSVTDMLKLGALGFEAKTDGIVSSQLPPNELLVEKNVRGADVISVNKDKLQLFIRNVFEGMTVEEALNGKPAVKNSVSPSPTPKTKK
jgi:hypothetical protein